MPNYNLRERQPVNYNQIHSQRNRAGQTNTNSRTSNPHHIRDNQDPIRDTNSRNNQGSIRDTQSHVTNDNSVRSNTRQPQHDTIRMSHTPVTSPPQALIDQAIQAYTQPQSTSQVQMHSHSSSNSSITNFDNILRTLMDQAGMNNDPSIIRSLQNGIYTTNYQGITDNYSDRVLPAQTNVSSASNVHFQASQPTRTHVPSASNVHFNNNQPAFR